MEVARRTGEVRVSALTGHLAARGLERDAVGAERERRRQAVPQFIEPYARGRAT